ncbi:MAG: cardiolipin synthase [Bacteroidaceae bacterium]
MWITIFFWSFITVYVSVVTSIILVVLLDNRQPVKAISWLLILLALPCIGLVLYYFFGQNIRKEKLISKKSLNLLTQNVVFDKTILERNQNYAPLIRYFERRNMAMPFVGNSLVLINTGAEYIEQLLRDIGRARHHIHLQSYIFEDDSIGRLVRDALIDATRRGVLVRLIYDDVGCWNVKQRFFDNMEKNGIQLQNFMPVRFPRFTHKANYRNHRKLCIIDGSVGFIGGMNIALRYVRGKEGTPWCDMQLRIEGGAVAALQQVFLTDWFFMSRVMINDTPYYPVSLQNKNVKNDSTVQIVTSGPASKWPDIMHGMTWAIQNSRNYVYIQSPYFMPTEPIMQALQTAATCGVDVRVMVPWKPDGKFLKWANNSFFTEALRAGVKVYTYRGGFLHSKMMVIDDEMCTIGSTNIDFRSFENNFEVNAFIYSPTMALQVKSTFYADTEHCIRLDSSIWKKRSIFLRLRESLVRLFSPML